jgi:hypothetical protein
MPLPDDIAQTVAGAFTGVDREAAMTLLTNVPLPEESRDPRLLRCALVASKGSIQRLMHYVALLAVDPRDVIVAGEYEVIEGKLTRVRDLSNPFVPRR